MAKENEFILNNELEEILKDIELRYKKIEFEINNGDYVIKEHCRELRRQVQLVKETKILQIEELADKFITRIDDYEQESLDTYSRFNKQNYEKQFNEIKELIDIANQELPSLEANTIKLNRMTNILKETRAKILYHQDELKYIFFKNNQMLSFMADETKVDHDILGGFSFSNCNLIDFNHLFKIDFRKAFNEFLIDSNSLDSQYLSTLTIFDFKFRNLSNEYLALACQYIDETRKNVIFLIIMDSNRKWKNYKKIRTICISQSELKLNSDFKIFISKEKVCVYARRSRGKFYEITTYNQSLEEINKIEITSLNLIGADEEKLFGISKEENEKPFYILDWSLHYLNIIGQRSDPYEPFYFPFECKQLITLQIKTKLYYVVNILDCVRIFDDTSGCIIREINDVKEIIKIDKDSNNNIILFRKDKVFYYSSDGYFIKEIKLINFELNLNSFFINQSNFNSLDPTSYTLSLF